MCSDLTNNGVCQSYLTSRFDDLSMFSEKQLQKSIEILVEQERYEEAVVYRDEILKRKK
jgi:hypothetical protein